MKILYIEDNRLLIDSVKKLLGETYVVDFMTTGYGGLEKARTVQYSLILLDLGLPDMEGIEVCRELRKSNIIAPILIMTVQKDPVTVVELLNSGADDYIAKPFNSSMLKARISALLRRGQELHEEKVIEVSDLTLNLTRRQVWRSGICISLRRKELIFSNTC